MFNFTDTIGASENGAWVHLKIGRKPAFFEDDKDRPCRIKVLGPDSPTLQDRLRKRVAARIKDAGGSIDLSKMSELEIESFLSDNQCAEAENFALATIEWENIPDGQGGTLEFTGSSDAEKLYKKYPAILRQIKEEAGDIDGFLALAERN